ncbi:type II toxin-antitoxin system YhaV family toxin [Erwiniaceae bacterium L1_54_6]|jgi:toxin YhaV|nr:type II toxin-antitoxin system YhaV family toxin [Erwiniaceae bacterium L1_54_6]
MPGVQKNVINGWAIFAHAAFLDAYKALVGRVEKIKEKHPDTYQSNAYTKLLAMVHKIIADITQDPGGSQFRQGSTLGEEHKHWLRGKFGNARYRLFYRFDSASKTIILGWLNDETTLRTTGGKHDAYKIFASLLKKKKPPTDWDELLAASHTDEVMSGLIDSLER